VAEHLLSSERAARLLLVGFWHKTCAIQKIKIMPTPGASQAMAHKQTPQINCSLRKTLTLILGNNPHPPLDITAVPSSNSGSVTR